MSSSSPSKVLTNQNGKKTVKFLTLVIIDLVILLLSIAIPYVLVSLNQTSSCSHHFEESGGNLWLVGRALGFTTFIFFLFTTIIGIKTKKIAKLLGSYQKAKDYHCLNAFLTNIIFIVHVAVLLNSDPWGPLVFQAEYNHIPFVLFATKIWTGILFAIMMVSTSIMFYFLRDVKRLKKFGYKRFIKVHHLMLLFTVFLAVHIFIINTEIMIILWD